MGQVHKLVAATADDARRQLMEVLSIKFSGGIAGSTGQGLTGLIQTLKNSIGQAMGNIGEGMLPAVKRMVSWITDALNKWIESGKLLELGKKMGEWLSSAVNHIMAFFDTLPKVFEAVTKLWNQGGENLGRVLNVAFTAGGTIIATAFVAALQASYDIWAGIAEMLGAAVGEALMSLPNMAGKRAGRAESAINAMPMDQLMATAKKAKIFGDHTDEVLATIGQATPETARFAIAKQVAKLGEKVQKQFIFAQAGNDFKAGAVRAVGAIPNMIGTISSTAKDELGKVNAALTSATGINIGGEYSKNLAIRQAEQVAAPSGFARYSTEKREFVPTATGGYSRMVPSGSFVGETGAYQKGQSVNGQTIVNIENLTIKANDTVQLQKELLKAGVYGGHAAAAAAAF
jgi:hypothetical protein